MNSNWTLRFPRTSRDAYGYNVSFNERQDRFDKFVFVFCAVLAAFILGLVIGGL